MLLIVCWVLLVPLALVTLLLIVPAPHYFLWKVAVAASELTFWIFLIAFVAGALGAVSYKLGRRAKRKLLWVPLCLFVLAVTGSLTFQAFALATKEGVQLDLLQCFLGGNRQLAPTESLPNVLYSKEGNTPLLLDVYKPSFKGGPYPAIIVIHGGSWRSGEKSDFPDLDRWLASQGIVVFDIEYRLADDQHHFPIQLQDIRKAIEFVRSQSHQYNVDRDRIALLGRSAGAQLALLTGYTSAAVGVPIRCVVSFYAPTDLTWDYAHPATPDVIGTQPVLRNYLGGSPSEMPKSYVEASPLQQATDHAPATLLLHGGRDQIVKAENMTLLSSKLQELKVPFECLFLPWGNHGFDWNYNSWDSQIVRHKIASFLQKYLLLKD